MRDLDAELHELRARIDRAARVCVLSGAGMSAESGIPTFRDALTGLWSRFDPAQLASEEGFRADPRLVWDWYAQRREGVRAAQPNAGHLALGAFAQRRPGVLTVVTQNVDDLHQRAGNADAIRLHGDILADRWLQPCRCRPRRDPGEAEPGRPPRCPGCGALVRPGVVWFGEMLPEGAMEAAERAARAAELMLVVGTSGAVWPAAGLAGTARRAGAFVAIVNPHDSEIDASAQLLLPGTAAQILPRLFA
ncbi:MAG: NAD-dependent protein deacylase [Piscinibacter sp.]|uniref:SIR2 family NAD-dependent protein deacylase n=1 Tax=Piscinibacter sp. TaxID=1903157 RepID=UPI001B660CBE|nr:NAD-dependent protein deacylase [Piscinibacter sp.]MBP5992305.1 NAD-dependent protein deacylase [Piscinibacter sp.]MBP6029766.1 NAD-dependent protein deacylase [Piscinibacter sp.]